MRKITLFLTLFFFPHFSPAAENAPPATHESAAEIAAHAQVADQMATIRRDIQWLEGELQEKQKALEHMDKDDAAEAEKDVSNLELRLQRAHDNFVALASDVELPPQEVNKDKTQKRDLVQEAQEMIEPVFDAIRRVSEKPRRIEAMRTRVFLLSERREQIDKAIAGLTKALATRTFPAFDKEIQESRQNLSHERDELAVRVDGLERKLNQETSDQRTVAQMVSGEFLSFMASKGRNLLFAFIAFFLVLWLLLRVKQFLLHWNFVRHALRSFHKPFHVFYSTAAAVLAVLATVMTLHFLNDWFLATLVMLIFFAAVWSMRSVGHHFVHEVKFILNLGTVKEGERVVWNGIPWLVERLGFRSTLVNECLQGGRIALPASVLGSLLSRETVHEEPWFPTRVGDYVQLEDGIFGKVEMQTPETVVLDCGTTRKQYSTTTFLARNPQNFSRGFELNTELVFRHGVEKYPLPELRENFRRILGKKLSLRLSGSAPCRLSSGVFPSGMSAARAWLTLECPGSLAAEHDQLKRELQAAAAESAAELK